MENCPLATRPARQADGGGRVADPAADGRGNRAGRMASLRPFGERRQGADRRDALGARRVAGVGNSTVGQSQILLRGRGGGGIGTSWATPRTICRSAEGRRVAVRRRTDTPVAAAANRLWRAWRDGGGAHGLRTVARTPQWPLRQLGTKSRHPVGEHHCQHAERRRAF